MSRGVIPGVPACGVGVEAGIGGGVEVDSTPVLEMASFCVLAAKEGRVEGVAQQGLVARSKGQAERTARCCELTGGKKSGGE